MDFCLLLKIWVKNISKNIIKILSGEYSQKLVDHAKQSATDVFKTASKRAIQKTAQATTDLISKKIVNKITRVSKNSEIVTDEHNKEIPKERYVSPEERQQIIYELRLK